MRIERFPSSGVVAVVCAFLATLFLIACQQSQPPTPAPTQAPEPKAANPVHVIFEGPWAFVPDPSDATKIIAIAPKTKGHRLLGVVPVNKSLEAGVYELVVPAQSAASSKFDRAIYRADVDTKAVQQALANRLERYAIRLPKPEAYVAETRFTSRIGPPPYPPSTTATDYVTAISLRYAPTSMTGFQLTGTPEVGPAFAPQLLSLDVPMVRFEIDPVDQPDDSCHTHSRQAFHDMARLLGISLYIDFPDSPDDCHKKDPQVGHAALLHSSPIDRLVRWDEGLTEPQTASVWGGLLASYPEPGIRTIVHGLVAAIYFFHFDSGACLGAQIVANGVG